MARSKADRRAKQAEQLVSRGTFNKKAGTITIKGRDGRTLSDAEARRRVDRRADRFAAAAKTKSSRSKKDNTVANVKKRNVSAGSRAVEARVSAIRGRRAKTSTTRAGKAGKALERQLTVEAGVIASGGSSSARSAGFPKQRKSKTQSANPRTRAALGSSGPPKAKSTGRGGAGAAASAAIAASLSRQIRGLGSGRSTSLSSGGLVFNKANVTTKSAQAKAKAKGTSKSRAQTPQSQGEKTNAILQAARDRVILGRHKSKSKGAK